MKKRIITFIYVLIIISLIIFLLGKIKKENKEAVAVITEYEIEQNTIQDEKELTYQEEIKSEFEKYENEGNIFPVNTYQIKDGFGYSVLEFHKFESYQQFVDSEYYNPDYVHFIPSLGVQEKKSRFIYAKIQIVNEETYEKTFMTGNCCLLCAQDGKIEPESYICQASPDCYATQRPDGGKDRGKFKLASGESMVLEIGAAIVYKDENMQAYYSIEDVFEHPVYYLSISGVGPNNGEGIDIRKNKSKIYINLEENE